MSASNWQVCPRCLHRAKVEAAETRAAVMALYGTVPVEEFDAKREALTEPDPEVFTTFREDYEFWGADEGHVQAKYSGTCSTCGLNVELRADRAFYEPRESGA